VKAALTILVLLPLLTQGQQNLVPNGSFEEYDFCPEGPAQWYLCHHWQNPNAASPDYFHSCNQPLVYVFGPDTVILPHLGVPANAFGYQHAHSGEAYMGIYCLSVMQPDAGEYIQVQLRDSIVPSVRYQVSFYVSLADNGRYAINTLGAYISKEAISSDGVQRFDVVPQILNTSANPLTDPDAWVLITDTFSSRYGGERYLTIGNFNTTATSDTVLYNPDGDVSANYAYYYIDDVSVVAIDSIPSGVNETEAFTLSVYPNPANEVLHISSRQRLASVRLMDFSGRAVLTERIRTGRNTLNLTGIPPGLYLLEAQDTEGRVAVQKVVVQ
jgi:OmpA-OmpF porin, OOP family